MALPARHADRLAYHMLWRMESLTDSNDADRDFDQGSRPDRYNGRNKFSGNANQLVEAGRTPRIDGHKSKDSSGQSFITSTIRDGPESHAS
jgi:hypothetical protein